MFSYCESLTNINALKNWDTRNVEEMDRMFNGCKSLKSYPKNLDELKSFTNKTSIIQDWDGIKIPSWI